MSGIASKQNAFKFKIAPHKQKSIGFLLAGKWAPLPNGILCLSTPKHNGKSGTALKPNQPVCSFFLMNVLVSPSCSSF
jgi:hypothetical protein